MAERRTVDGGGTGEERVVPLELFFDLVFVLAFTQVTGLMSDDPTWGGLLRGMLVLAAIWWSWVGYAWMTNFVDPEEGAVRLAMFGVMAALLVAALAVPDSFDDGALTFGIAYLLVRVLHVAVYFYGSEDPDVLRSIRLFAFTAVLGPVIIVAASALDGAPQALAWGAALVVDYAGPAVWGMSGWRVSAGHFAERHGLIVIIALGESIVSVGVGAGHSEIDAGVVLAAVLATVLAATLWWAYFDVAALAAERHLHEETDRTRQNTLARDAYSYIHLALIAGIVLAALGVKKTIGDTGAELETIPAFALCGGVALYLLGHVGFRFRNIRTLSKQRIVAALACLALFPLAPALPAVASLAAVATVTTTLIVYEVIRFRDSRRRTRAALT